MFSRRSSVHGRRPAKPSHRRFTPRLEPLEKRCLLAAVSGHAADAPFEDDSDGAIMAAAHGDEATVDRGFIFGGAVFDIPVGGRNRWGVATGDFDGDGEPDIVSVGDGGIYLHRRAGVGGFDRVIRISHDAARSVAAGDINNDGHLDLVAVGLHFSGSTWLGNGAGEFTKVDQFVPHGSEYVALGDFNGDQNLDLVLTGRDSSHRNSEMWLGDGTGRFLFPTSTESFGRSHRPAVGDLNGDGHLDIVLARADSVEVYVNDGAGGFGTFNGSFLRGETYTVAGTVEDLALGDVTGDGVVDIVTINHSTSTTTAMATASVLAGLGDGAFAVRADYTLLNYPQAVALGDVDEDGVLDVVAATGVGFFGNISVFRADDVGGLTPTQVYSVGASPRDVELRDLDGDGHFDIVVVHSERHPGLILRGDGAGGFLSYDAADLGVDRFTRIEAITGDANNDGLLDIVTTESWRNRVRVHTNLGNGRFATSQAYRVEGVGGLSAWRFEDMNADGVTDLIATAQMQIDDAGRNHVLVFLGDGRGGLSAPVTSATTAGPFSLHLVDVTGDGVLDLIDADAETSQHLIRQGDATGRFTPAGEIVLGESPSQIQTADLNDDGAVDFLYFITGENVIHVRFGDGKGGFALAESIATPSEFSEFVVGDVNGDQRSDITLVLHAANQFSELVSTTRGLLAGPEGAFQATAPFEHDVRLGFPQLVDVDGDGHLDLVGVNNRSSRHSSIVVRFGDGQGNFSVGATFFGIVRYSPPLLVDLDGDGDLDIVGEADDARRLQILRNQAAGPDFDPIVTGLPGDANGDRVVDLTDLNAVRNNFGGSGEGDANGDGVVDLADLNAVRNNFGASLEELLSSEIVYTITPPPAAAPLAAPLEDNADGAIMAAAHGDEATVDRGFLFGGAVFDSPESSTVNARLAVAMGDFDEDGVLDMVSVGDRAIYLHRRDEGGGFGRITRISRESARSVAAGDINNDGHLDIVAVGADGRGAMLLGNGAGEFTGVLLDLSGHEYVVLGDFNGDQNLDMLLTGRYSDHRNSEIWFGDGTGRFGSRDPDLREHFGRSHRPAVGDLNGDGHPDVVLARAASVDVYLNDGLGGFGTPTHDLWVGERFAMPGVVEDLVVRDVTGDGVPDIVGVIAQDTSLPPLVSVLAGLGDGGFAEHVDYPIAGWSSIMQAVTVGDVNGDGRPDIVAVARGGAGGGLASVLLADGAGGFLPANAFPIAGFPRDVELGDMDGDGHVDIVAMHGEKRQSLILRGDGAGNFLSFEAVAFNSTPLSRLTVITGDANNDGLIDIVTTDFFGSNRIQIHLNLGDGRYAVSKSFRVDGVRHLYPSLFADMNGDGNADFVVTWGTSTNGEWDHGVLVFLGDGQGGLAAPVASEPERKGFTLGPVDFTGDGVLDAIEFDVEANQYLILAGDAAGRFTPIGDLTLGETNSRKQTADLNDDGAVDILYFIPGESIIHVRHGDGVGGFAEPQSIPTPSEFSEFVVGDVNGDGRSDIVLVSTRVGPFFQSASTTWALLADAEGAFQPAAPVEHDVSLGFPQLVDVDRDGNLDLVGVQNDSSSRHSSIVVRFGDGQGGFPTGGMFFREGTSDRPIIVDLDNDGDLDIIHEQAYPAFLFVLRNQAAGPDFDPIVIGLPGDANGDRVVDLTDLNAVRNNFGGSGAGDANGDGVVDLADLNAVRNNFGASLEELLSSEIVYTITPPPAAAPFTALGPLASDAPATSDVPTPKVVSNGSTIARPARSVMIADALSSSFTPALRRVDGKPVLSEQPPRLASKVSTTSLSPQASAERREMFTRRVAAGERLPTPAERAAWDEALVGLLAEWR